MDDSRVISSIPDANSYMESIIKKSKSKVSNCRKHHRVRSNITFLTEEATPKTNYTSKAPGKLIKIVTDEFPDTERTVYKIVKEEEKSFEISSREKDLKSLDTTGQYPISKKKKNVDFKSTESRMEEIEQSKEV